MDAKELTEVIEPVPAKAGENINVMVRSVEIYYRESDQKEVKDRNGNIVTPLKPKGELEHVIVRLITNDGRKLTKTATDPVKCRALIKRALLP